METMLKTKPVCQENFKDLPDFRLFPYSCKYCVYWETVGNFDEKVEQKIIISKSQITKSTYYPELSIKSDKKYKIVATS